VIGDAPAEFAKSTSGLKDPSKYCRKQIPPSDELEICSQRSAYREIDMEIERG